MGLLLTRRSRIRRSGSTRSPPTYRAPAQDEAPTASDQIQVGASGDTQMTSSYPPQPDVTNPSAGAL